MIGLGFCEIRLGVFKGWLGLLKERLFRAWGSLGRRVVEGFEGWLGLFRPVEGWGCLGFRAVLGLRVV